MVTDRSPSYDLLLARESESRERIAKALFQMEIDHGNGVYNYAKIRGILAEEKGI